MRLTTILIFVVLLTISSVFGSANAQTPHREVAITFDDLPFVSTARDADSRDLMTEKLLAAMTSNRVPIIGFVNERQLHDGDKLDDRSVALLHRWLQAGTDLGNHTFSHHSLNSTPLADYENDLLRGEIVLRELLKERGKTPRYFRHPFLQTGRSLETRGEFEKFLKEHGYTVAPVTIDNSDWIFARAYDNARDAGDKAAMQQVGDAYVPYMESKVAHYERQSAKLFNREIKQVLLLHANAINADYFKDLVAMLKKRGYKFTSLAEALTDPAYSSDDKYIGPAGISWLDRWALTRGVPKDFFKGEPRTPEFVMKLANVDSE